MAHIAKTTGKPDKRMKKIPKGFDAVGRPEKVIDWAKVDDLLMAGCTCVEVAAYFDMHPITFGHRVSERHGVNFTVYSSQKKQHGESILRAHQYAKALGLTKDGDNTLLIWLGKQRLNQSESPTDLTVNEALDKNFEAVINQMNELLKKE